jgi:hypothetical protein
MHAARSGEYDGNEEEPQMPSHVWIAPQNPDLSAILHGAVFDAHAGRYEEALAKHLWFHRSAIRFEPAFGSVRLSFAVAYWWNLASFYPPAREAFIQTRDETEQRFRKTPSDFALFQDVAAMNDRMGDGIRTAMLFETIADIEPDHAPRLYRVAEPYLIAAGRYHACAPFLETKRRMEQSTRFYDILRQHEESRPKGKHHIPKSARSHYVCDVATLVALLALNDRADEARSAYVDALKILDDDDFRMIMDAALSGHLPAHRL